MTGHITVAYATRYGSTAEVAEAVAARLRASGNDVRVTPAASVETFEGTDAVILGAPLYIGSLLKDAVTFLERHREGLSAVPVAVFALGPLSAEEAGGEGTGQLDEALAKTAPWLVPAAAAVFVGKYDPAKLRFADRLLAALPASPLHGLPASDGRDWSGIEAWADRLPDLLATRV